MDDDPASAAEDAPGTGGSTGIGVGGPDDEALDAFKCDVRTWLEVDTSIRTLQESIRERRQAKHLLTARILSFMAEYNIEDLATRNGRLRFQVSYVRAPLSHKAIRARIADYFAANEPAAIEIDTVVFGNRERAERTSLRRVSHVR
jgi:hypothetical protein